MIRLQVLISCDAPGCPRSTTASAEYKPILSSPGFGKLGYQPGYKVTFPPAPDGSATGWGGRGDKTWCPDHAKEQPT